MLVARRPSKAFTAVSVENIILAGALSLRRGMDSDAV
jgi:hypothetical protein